ncbi:MAG TPA: hypothetical protein VHE55_19900 [Fimbriimonadaceae bacterium]|nr:hypothetical protein [Fimbriimonadaceae bacterium]
MRQGTMRDLFEKWGLTGMKVNLGFWTGEFNPRDPDRAAAWELYVELLTRVSTQYLPPEHGDEKTALDSVHSLFATTRKILKRQGSGCVQFSKVAIVVLNQVVRPFTAEWHKRSLAGAFSDADACKEFRKDLEDLQSKLRSYTHILAEIADVEDLTDLERPVAP